MVIMDARAIIDLVVTIRPTIAVESPARIRAYRWSGGMVVKSHFRLLHYAVKIVRYLKLIHIMWYQSGFLLQMFCIETSEKQEAEMKVIGRYLNMCTQMTWTFK